MNSSSIALHGRDGRLPAFVGFLTLLAAALMLCFDGTRDGDLYLQLASGRFISAHGLSAVDPFNTIAHGEPWLNQQWLPELLSYLTASAVGVTGLTILYACVVASPLALLLWLCRRKGLAMMIALVLLYCPGVWVIAHPRAAGFSLLAFSALVSILVLAWIGRRADPPSAARLRLAVPGTLLLFGLWANLHGAFVTGLVLIAVTVCGLALERLLGVAGAAAGRRIALLGLTGALGLAITLVATPLGTGLLAYLLSFSNPAIAMASPEWRPALQSPFALAYLAVAAAFAAALWIRTPRPRPLVGALAVLVFLVMGLVSQRNVVFVGPVIALAIVTLAPDRPLAIPRALVVAAAVGAAAAAAVWALAVGPARNEPILGPRLIGYAIHHPPPHGRIASYAGVGSYMLWRSAQTPVVLDGWLEHFSAGELRETYAVVDGRVAEPMPFVRRLRIGAVIADRHRAIAILRAHGFAVEFRTAAGTYLVRRASPPQRRPGEPHRAGATATVG